MKQESISSKNYPGIFEMVYAPNWYLKGHEDLYSQKILSSKKSDESEFFKPFLKDMIENLKNQMIFPENIKLITIVPNSHLSYSPTLISLGKWLANYFESEFKIIIVPNKECRRNISGNTCEERFNITKGSMYINQEISDKENMILLLDDTKTTGTTTLECIKILKEKGARIIYPICLGINHNLRFFNEK